MNVYLFKLDKSHIYGSGQAIVTANDPHQAWDCLEKELGWESEFFNPDKYEQVHSLTSLLHEPSVITYNCYIE